MQHASPWCPSRTDVASCSAAAHWQRCSHAGGPARRQSHSLPGSTSLAKHLWGRLSSHGAGSLGHAWHRGEKRRPLSSGALAVQTRSATHPIRLAGAPACRTQRLGVGGPVCGPGCHGPCLLSKANICRQPPAPVVRLLFRPGYRSTCRAAAAAAACQPSTELGRERQAVAAWAVPQQPSVVLQHLPHITCGESYPPSS